MDKQSRREIVRNYKERKVSAGVFALRCLATGEVWTGISRNLDGQKNGSVFSLRMGSHPNRALQAAWNAHGEPAFEFEILQTLQDEALTPLGREHWLKTCEGEWRARLEARAATG